MLSTRHELAGYQVLITVVIIVIFFINTCNIISTYPSYSDPAPSDISSGRDRFIAVDVTGPGILLAGVLPLNHVLSVSEMKDVFM